MKHPVSQAGRTGNTVPEAVQRQEELSGGQRHVATV